MMLILARRVAVYARSYAVPYFLPALSSSLLLLCCRAFRVCRAIEPSAARRGGASGMIYAAREGLAGGGGEGERYFSACRRRAICYLSQAYVCGLLLLRRALRPFRASCFAMPLLPSDFALSICLLSAFSPAHLPTDIPLTHDREKVL